MVESVENLSPGGGPNVIGNVADIENDDGESREKNGEESEEKVLLSSQEDGESSTGFLKKIFNRTSPKKAKDTSLQSKTKDAKEKEEFD